MNKQLYNDLLNASYILLAQKKIQNKIRTLKEKIFLRERERKELETLLLNDKPWGYGTKRGWATALFIVAGVILVPIVQAINRSPMITEVLIMMGMCIGSSAIAALLLVSAHASLKKKTAQDEQRIKKQFDEDKVKNQADSAEISQLNKENAQLLDNGKAFLEILPETYRNAEAACFMILAVKDGRADNLKEAMNMYEEQLHRWKMENMLQDALQMQQIHAETMDSVVREIVSNQESINDNLASIASLQSIQFMQNNF